VISASVGRDVGLLCAFAIPPGDERVRELAPPEIDAELARTDGIVWLHFNLSNARARQIIAQFAFLPAELRETFCNHEQRRRVEVVDGGVLAVFSDLTFEEASEPAEVATLWCYLAGRLFLTGRTHPLQTPDRLRAAVRTGLRVGTAGELLIWILNRRTSSLRDLEVSMSEQVGDIEDEILGGRIREQREQLGRIRRYCAQLRRHFGPDRTAFRRLLQQAPAALGPEEIEGLRNEIEDLGFLVDEAAELYERSKLLQEELASRVAENTGRSLYVLAILSAVFLPMTLITGIFGMNVAGLPGLSHHSAFWWVLLLILISGTGTLALIRRNRS
jgi:zinc transporter